MDYITHLSKDRKLKKLIEQQGQYKLVKHKNVSLHLCASIMSQQLSTKVADVIYRRFLDLYGGKEPTPLQIERTKHETLRAIGLSNAKAAYVHNVACFTLEKGMDIKQLDNMSNEEIISYLTPIKGVGRWTVEMLLMFVLGREDVFAVDDLGIQIAMRKLYKLDEDDKKEMKKNMIQIAEKWSPYRTYACRYLWGFKDNSLDV